jgi:hypothetical protein
MVYHKERLLEPANSATRGSLEAWAPPPPDETATPLPGRQGYFDGSIASAAAVGQGDLPAETPILLREDAAQGGGTPPSTEREG